MYSSTNLQLDTVLENNGYAEDEIKGKKGYIHIYKFPVVKQSLLLNISLVILIHDLLACTT